MFSCVLALDRCGQTGVVGRLRVWPEDGQAWSMRESTEGSLHLLGWKDVCALQIFHADNIRGVSQVVSLTDGTYFIPFTVAEASERRAMAVFPRTVDARFPD